MFRFPRASHNMRPPINRSAGKGSHGRRSVRVTEPLAWQWVTILRIKTKATNRTARQIGQPRARELQGHRKEPMQEVTKKSKDEAIGNRTYGNVRFALTNVFADWLLEVQWTKIARTSWTMDEITSTSNTFDIVSWNNLLQTVGATRTVFRLVFLAYMDHSSKCAWPRMAILLSPKVWRKLMRVFCVTRPAYMTDCETY